MISQPDPPVRTLHWLLLAVLVGIATSVVVVPFLYWLAFLIFREPVPPAPVWADFLVVRGVAGAFTGAAMYASSRLSHGWLRTCLYWTAFTLLVGGTIDDFAREPLHRFLSVWAVSGLIVGVLFGTVFHALEGRNRRRVAADRHPGDNP